MTLIDIPKPLTDEQISFFEREGYLMVPEVFTDEELQPVIDELDEEVNRRAQELVDEGKLSRTYKEYGFTRQLAMISQETDKIALSIWNGVLASPAIFGIIRNPQLLDVAEQMCGPELIASSVYRLRPKIPNHRYGAVPWHQDSGYTEPYCDKALMLTVWLPLVDADEENGCMWVLPRAHKGPVAKHGLGKAGTYLEIYPQDLPEGKPKCCPVAKGGALFLTNRTPHASFDNKTDIVRWSMDLRYQSASLPTNAQITRLPEEVVDGPGVPPACYPPEADFLVRSRKRPNEVVTEPEKFRRIRHDHLVKPVTNRWFGEWKPPLEQEAAKS